MTGDERYARASSPCGLRNRDAHPAAAVVRDEPDRIDWLPGCSCGHNYLSARKISLLDESNDMRDDRVRFRHPSRPSPFAHREWADTCGQDVVAKHTHG